MSRKDGSFHYKLQFLFQAILEDKEKNDFVKFFVKRGSNCKKKEEMISEQEVK